MDDDRTVLGRTLRVVEACLESGRPVSLADLTRRCGLPKPTVRRLAGQLVDHGLLVREPSGYISGPGLAELACRAEAQHGQRAWLTPFLADLHRRTDAAVWVVDTGVRSWPVLASVYGRRAAASGYADSWPHDPSDPAILATALGRLALSADPGQAELLVRAGARPLTPRTDVRPRSLLAAVARAGESREAVEHEGVVTGWSCLAVGVDVPGRQPGLVLGMVERVPRFRTTAYLAEAHRAAAELARHWPPPASLLGAPG